jgi:hypothetical protein
MGIFSLPHAYHQITPSNIHNSSRVLTYKFDQNKAYMNEVTYASINSLITTESWHLINYPNNKYAHNHVKEAHVALWHVVCCETSHKVTSGLHGTSLKG